MAITDEEIIQQWEKLARLTNESLSDEELSRKALHNAKKAQLTSDYSTLTEIVGEQRACAAILQERAEIRNSVEVMRKKWVEGIESHRCDIFLNLKNAASANGQLIAAILEDERKGMTKEEIAGWCDELSSLPDEDMKKLLSELVKEGVIMRQKDGKYYLLQVCTPDLYPPDRLQWALDRLNTKLATLNRHSDDCKALKAILYIIDEKDSPVASIDILDTYKKSRIWKKYAGDIDLGPGFKVEYGVFCDYLDDLHKYGILTRHSTNLSNYAIDYSTVYLYFFPMLGDTEGGNK